MAAVDLPTDSERSIPNGRTGDIEKDEVAVNSSHSNHPSIESKNEDGVESDDVAETSPKSDNRPRHATTGEPLSLPREILLVTVVCLAQLITQAGVGQALATTIIAGNSLGITDPNTRSWEIAAYSLAVGTFILPAGRWGDLFGHKRLFVFGFLWFALWSLLAGMSVWVNPIFFFFCRGMQGIGPAIVLPNGIAILGTVYLPSPRQNMAFAMFGSVAPSGANLGAVFASIFAQFAWWPWAYWTTAIVCLCVALLAWVVIPSAPAKDDSSNLFRRLDVIGSILGVGGLVFINVAWNQGSSIGWTTTYTYILLIIGFLLLGIFAFVETRVEYPLIPTNIFNRKVSFVLACIACGWATFGIWVFYIFQFLLVLRRETPLLVSADLAPASISGLCAAVTTGVLMSRIRPAYIMLVALICFTVGTILVATAPIDQTYWAQIFVSTIITPWGMDMSFPAGTLILSGAMPREHQGLAASLVSTVVNYSISLGLGFAGTVESNVAPGTGEMEVLKGYRAALYMGIGLAGLGVAVAAVFTFVTRPRGGRARKTA
ncbi:MAG: hypothetical protein LQ352_006998 [Teloschistes flavicans]|nr:MAG: hypothetical protein LQ352_006998 [Teloschistes flavicans]